jgi:uncharacterized protein involved in outer membrane biogenesis
MKALRSYLRRGPLAVLTVLGAGIALALLALALTDGTWLRLPLAHLISEHTHRDIRIDGPLHAQLLTTHPSLTAEHVTLGNPPWSKPGTLARVDKLTIRVDLPWRGRPFAIRALLLEGLDLSLQRDIEGHANWYWQAPGTLPGKGAPLLYSLSIPNAHVTVEDDRRHLVFDGILTIPIQSDRSAQLQIDVRGHLNGRDVVLRMAGDPLATVAKDKPYHFNLEERSSGSEVAWQGSLSQPFDFRLLEGTFTAHGADLKDLYFLAGVIMPNTGPYRLSGKITRHYTTFTLSDLLATTGESDIRGTVVSEMFASGKSHVDIDLHSHRVRRADLGPQAAGRAAGPADAKPLLLSETEIRVAGIRRTNSAIKYHAQEIDAGALSFRSVVAEMSVDYGEVKVPRLSAILHDGTLNAQGSLDARPETPTASLDLKFSNVRVRQMFRENPADPPLDGTLNGHLNVTGRGRSLHELAANANGTVNMTLPEGVMRASLAEAAGTNLRGLELLLAHSKQETPIRCAVASFQVRNGALLARQLTIDTDRMLINGGGSIQLGTEAIDLRIQGEPKGLRLLRLSGPLSIQGTLRHPTLQLEKHDRKIELIDPGHGKDVDCATLTAEVRAANPDGAAR